MQGSDTTFDKSVRLLKLENTHLTWESVGKEIGKTKGMNKIEVKYTYDQLLKAIENYNETARNNEPKFRKKSANFFGVNEKPFLDYLPENFIKSKPPQPRTYATEESINARRNE